MKAQPRDNEPMNSADAPLPSFETPPLTEVVFGLQFEPLERLACAHLGLLWQEYINDYPHSRDMPPLMQVIESDVSTTQAQPEVSLLLNEHIPRVWFRQDGDNGIVQVQRDRFLHNWKRVKEGEEYPRYPLVRKMFGDRLDVFEAFLARQNLGSIKPTQYELTYVNHIVVAPDSTISATVSRTMPDCVWRNHSERFLPMPESLRLHYSFALPDNQGRLHSAVRSGRRVSDNSELIVFELTARGMPDLPNRESMWGWFDMAHEWIVRAFADLTDSEVQVQSWRRTI